MSAVVVKDSLIPSVALAPSAANLFYVSSENNGELEGACE